MATKQADSELLIDGGQQVDGSGALMALNASEIDTQIATAKRYPRSVKRFLDEAREMVTLTEEIAGECIYALPRDGKTIEGPSARFAEIALSAWGNCRGGARIVEEGGRFVTAQGVFLDLQHNTAITYEVRRRITNRSGQRFKDDMIGVTANAACSIALRNAILKGIPKAFWKPLYEDARKAAVGDVKTLANRRAAMLLAFSKMGVTAEMVFSKLEIKGAEDITLDHLALLRGMFTAIKEGDSTVEEAFAKERTAEDAAKSLSELTDRLEAGLGGRKDSAGPPSDEPAQGQSPDDKPDPQPEAEPEQAPEQEPSPTQPETTKPEPPETTAPEKIDPATANLVDIIIGMMRNAKNHAAGLKIYNQAGEGTLGDLSEAELAALNASWADIEPVLKAKSAKPTKEQQKSLV